MTEIGIDAIERILVAIGEKDIPPDLDKDRLAIGLGDCLETYYAAVERNSDKRLKNQIRRLKSIRTTAVQFKKQLVPDEIWNWTGEFWEAEYLSANVGDLIDRLNHKIEDLGFELRIGLDWEEAIRLKVEARSYTDRWRARSPFEWLAGYYLPELFRKQFGAKPTFHRRAVDNLPDGPMIRFIERALVEFGIKNRGRFYSRETIAKAITDVRNRRVRKKGGRVGQN